MTLFVDSSILVAAYLQEPFSERAREAIREWRKREELVVDTLICAEVFLAVRRRSGLEEARRAVAGVLDHFRYVEVPIGAWRRSLPKFDGDFGDTLIEENCAGYTGRVLTADGDFARRLGERAVVVK